MRVDVTVTVEIERDEESFPDLADQAEHVVESALAIGLDGDVLSVESGDWTVVG